MAASVLPGENVSPIRTDDMPAAERPS